MQIVIPIYQSFTALDAVGPYEVLSRIPGAEVTFAAAEAGPVTTDTGILTLTAPVALSDVTSPDVIVVPGGPGTREMVADKPLISWIQQVHPGTTWTTSVCTGSLILAAAGVLDGMPEATTHWACDSLLEGLGTSYTPQRVVQHGKVITAAGVSSGIDMALTLVAHLAGDDVAKAIQLSIEYDPEPPFDSGSVANADPAIVELVRAVIADESPDMVSSES